jgi:hypothetical protein
MIVATRLHIVNSKHAAGMLNRGDHLPEARSASGRNGEITCRPRDYPPFENAVISGQVYFLLDIKCAYLQWNILILINQFERPYLLAGHMKIPNLRQIAAPLILACKVTRLIQVLCSIVFRRFGT